MPMKKKIVLLSLLTLSLRAVVATPEKAMADVQVARYMTNRMRPYGRRVF